MISSLFKVAIKSEARARGRKRHYIALNSVLSGGGNGLLHIGYVDYFDGVIAVIIGFFYSLFDLGSGVAEQNENLDLVVDYGTERLIRNVFVVAAGDDDDFLIVERESSERGSCWA